VLLCDTNVLSELARAEPNTGVLAWADTVSAVAVSVVTIEEIAFGVAWRPNERVQAFLDDFFDRRCRVLPVTRQIARRGGHLRGSLRSRGITLSQAGGLIAGTAQVHGATVVTRNARDFEHCQVPVLNPFT